MPEIALSSHAADKNKLILGYILLTAIAGLGVGIARIVTTLYAVDLHATTWQMGLIAGAQSVGILLMSLPVGILIERYGPMILFALGSFFGALLYAVTPLVRSTEYLLLCTTAMSFLMPLRFISLNSVFMQQLERFGTAKAGWFRGTHMIGFFLLGPVIAVWLISKIHFTGTFWVVAVSFLGTMLIAPFVLTGLHTSSGRKPKLNLTEIIEQLTLLKTDADLRRASIVEFISQGSTAYFGFFIVVIAIQNFGLTATAAATLLTVHGAVFVATLFTMGAFVTRCGHKRFYQASFVLIATSLFLLGLTHCSVVLWLGSLILGLGMGMLHIVNFTLFALVGKRHGRGRVSGLVALSGPAGGLIGSLLGGAVGHLFGLQFLFLPFAVLFVYLIWQVNAMLPLGANVTVEENLVPEIESEI